MHTDDYRVTGKSRGLHPLGTGGLFLPKDESYKKSMKTYKEMRSRLKAEKKKRK